MELNSYKSQKPLQVQRFRHLDTLVTGAQSLAFMRSGNGYKDGLRRPENPF